MTGSLPSQTLRFGAFEVDLRAGELRKKGIKVKLQEKPFQILALLLEHAGEVVTREDLRQKLWPADIIVDFDHSLGTAIGKLRQSLGDTAQNPRFVETLSNRGYRFIAPVSAVEEGAGSPPQNSTPEDVVPPFSAFELAIPVTWRQPRTPPAGLERIESLAVLPLVNVSGDDGQEYFVDGMTDELITELAKIGLLRVISRTSTMRYKASSKSLGQIARELNVDAVVEGTVLRSEDRVRITAQLIHAATDRHLWAESYERHLKDVMALQDEVAGAIASRIQIKLTSHEKAQLAASRPVDPEAYEPISKDAIS
jgi:TolB-like protein/DNA-binding winged helix-turn-helix (wHTH) protein